MVKLLSLLFVSMLAACSWSLPPIPCTGDDNCPQDQSCQAGTCAALPACTGTTQACGANCVDLSQDNGNCGSCGNSCGGTLTCQGGTCVGTSGGTHTLTVVMSGQGSGTVTSAPSGINCPTGACSKTFASGTQVTLTAVPANQSSSFAGWSGACQGSGACTLSLSSDKQVTANFTNSQTPTHTLSVTVNGNGTVTSSPSGINCSSGTCSSSFAEGTAVTLSQAPGNNASFNSWGGDCGGAGACSVTLSSDRSVSAYFSSNAGVSVSVTVNGSGSISSSPSGLYCTAGTCQASFTPGATVTLTASPLENWIVQSWGGACSGVVGNTCTLSSIQGDQSASVTFIMLVPLTINVGGPGTVTSVPSGINCTSMGGAGCWAAFLPGTSVTLTAVPDGNGIFSGYNGGGCGIAATCTISLTSATGVGATFEATYLLSVSATGAGSGTITSDVGGIGCASGGAGTCSARVAPGTTVTLTATPGLHSAFGSWTGCLSPNGGSCGVTLWSDTTISGAFNVGHELTVNVAGSGAGTVHTSASGAADLACSSGACTQMIVSGTSVYLYAQAEVGSIVAGVVGPGCSGTSCSFTMDADTSVSVTIQTLRTLSVTVSGGGYVDSDVTGINCYLGSGSGCTHDFADGSVINLTAKVSGTPAWAYFVGWSGDCSGRGACSLTMDSAHSVHADFLVFTLSSDNDYQHPLSLLPGESRALHVTTVLVADTVAAPVDVTVTGLPTGVTAAFSPATATPTATTTLTLTAAADAPRNDYAQVTVHAIAGTGQGDAFEVTLDVYLAVRSLHALTEALGVVIEPGGATALVTETDRLVRVDVATRAPLKTVASGLGAAPGSVVLEASGTALVASDDSIWRVNLSTGALTRIPTPTTGTLVLAKARGLSLKGATMAVVTDCEATDCAKGRVLTVDLGTGALTRLNTGSNYLNTPKGVAVEASGSTALVAEFGAARLIRINLDTGSFISISGGIPQIEGVALEAGGATALVTTPRTDLVRVVLASGTKTTIAELSNTCCGIRSLGDVAVEEGGGMVLVADRGSFSFEGGRLLRVAVGSGVRTLAPSRSSNDTLYTPWGVALQDATTALVTDCGASGCAATGRVMTVNLATGDINPVTNTALDTPRGIALEPGGLYAVVAEWGASRLVRVKLSDGTLTSLAAGLDQPIDVAVSGDGTYALVTTRTDLKKVLLQPPYTVTSLVGSLATTCGGCLGLGGVAISPDGTKALVIDLGAYSPNGAQILLVTLGPTPEASVFLTGLGAGDISPSGRGPFGVAWSVDGTKVLLTARGEDQQQQLFQFDVAVPPPPSHEYTVLAGGLGLPTGVVAEASGTSALVVDGDPGNSRLVRVPFATAYAPVSIAHGLPKPAAFALEAGGTTALFVDCGYADADCSVNGRLARLDLASGAVSAIYPVTGTGFNRPAGVAIEDATHALVTHCGPSNLTCDAASRLVRVDLVNGTVSLVAGAFNALGPVHVEAGSPPSSVLVLEKGQNRLLRIHLADGSFDPLASGFNGALDFEIEGSGNSVILAANEQLGRIDLATGVLKTLINHSGANSLTFAIEPGGATVLFTQALSPYGSPGILLARGNLATGGITAYSSALSDGAVGFIKEANGTSALLLENRRMSGAVVRVPVP